jgi:hypothetical protein
MGGGQEHETRDALDALRRQGKLRDDALPVAHVCVLQFMSTKDPSETWVQTVAMTPTDPETVAGILTVAAEEAAGEHPEP